MSSGLPAPLRPRALQGLERLWLAADRVERPFVIHAVVEGRLDRAEGWEERVRAAVHAAAAAHPGLRLRLAGYGPWLRWASDGAPPAVAVVDGAGWTGEGPEDAAWLDRPLALRGGPAVEVLLVRGEPERLVLRIHHAQADGRAIQGYLHSVFAALRGEVPAPASLAPRDLDLVGGLLGGAALPRWSAPPRDRPALLGAVRPAALRSTWAHVRVDGVGPRAVLPRVLLALRDLDGTGAGLRASVPVDLRPPGARWDGNLTGIATLSPPDFADASTLRAALDAARDPRACAPLLAFADGLRLLPLWLVGRSGRGAARAQLRAARFETSLTLSNLGRADLAALSGGGFVATRAWWIPPPAPGNPLFILLSGDADGVDLCASAPEGLADDGRLPALLRRVGDALRA